MANLNADTWCLFEKRSKAQDRRSIKRKLNFTLSHTNGCYATIWMAAIGVENELKILVVSNRVVIGLSNLTKSSCPVID